MLWGNVKMVWRGCNLPLEYDKKIRVKVDGMVWNKKTITTKEL